MGAGGPSRRGDGPSFGFVLRSVIGWRICRRRGGTMPVPRSCCAATSRSRSRSSIIWGSNRDALARDELDSYYDGVHGWSGLDRRVTPMIQPVAHSSVRFTPPRAGTFIYHTHLHDERQLHVGLYGAMLVLERRRDRSIRRPITSSSSARPG